MEPRSLDYVCRACGGELAGGSAGTLVSGVSTDSRQIAKGVLFFAIKGDKFDGHDFVEEVGKKGAAAAVVERGCTKAAGVTTVVVEDTRKALGKFAARYRQDFRLPVVAVAGSNGKTTTKELIASVLQQEVPVVWSAASFNNEIGVPLTLLKIESKHRAAVLEVGTNHPGELRALLKLVQPDLGVITSIGREHLEFFGTVEGVAQEEGSLGESLPDSGTLFLNGDSEWTPHIAQRARAKTALVGMARENTWRGELVSMDESGVRFRVTAPREDFNGEYKTNLLGRHQITNAMFALAVGAELGLSAAAARRGLDLAQPPKMRMQSWQAGGVCVLDDSYNANADSMLAALQTLADLSCSGRRIAVLGDMAELGQHAESAHREVGRRAAELKINLLIGVGKFAEPTINAATQAGLGAVLRFDSVEAAAADVSDVVGAGDLVLLKASRATGLERIGERLRARFGEKKSL